MLQHGWFKTGNIDEMFSHVKDTHATDATTLRANYEYYIKTKKARHTQLKVLGIQKVDANDFKVNFEMSSDQYQPAEFSLPMINDNGTWKVLVDGKAAKGCNRFYIEPTTPSNGPGNSYRSIN